MLYRSLLLIAGLLVISQPGLVAQVDDPVESAVVRAVDAVMPSLVRIETLGGLEKVGAMLVGTGPTTGLVVDPQGYIISSAINFAQTPSQILVYTADGERHPAKLIATDENHKLVLLKIEADQPLPVPVVAPTKEYRVGQSVIALGRAFESDKPNLSVGILSAVNRVWGKAVQTDAKISPNNYGGPLIDLSGRVLGILTPLTPHPGGDDAGVEWYDSGIGFAVPLETVNRVLPRLKKGETLVPGLLGISLRGKDVYADPVVIGVVQPNSPAAKAGWKPGDKIIEVAGLPVTRQAQLKHALGPYFAGDKVAVKLTRSSETIESEVTLVGKPTPVPLSFLGLLPARDKDLSKPGVAIRGLYAGSPVAKAGLQATDLITAIDDQPVKDRDALVEYLNTLAPDREVQLTVDRSGKPAKLSLKVTRMPETLPSEVPPARTAFAPLPVDQTGNGLITIKIPEVKNECTLFVPKTYNRNIPHGLVIWLGAPGAVKTETLSAQVAALCERHDILVLFPRSADDAKWERGELDFLRKAAEDAMGKYNIDRARIAVMGYDGGGAMAWLMALQQKDLVRGAILINSPLPAGIKVPPLEAVNRLSLLCVTPAQGPAAAKFQPLIKGLRDGFYPVTTIPTPENPTPPDAEFCAPLWRWIDTLDRL